MIHSKITTQEPLNFVTLNEAKRQLNIIDRTDDDLDIYDKLVTSMQLAEKATKRKLSPCTVNLFIKGECALYLPYGEVLAITSVKVGTEDIEYSFNPITQYLEITGSVTDDDEIIVIYDAGYLSPKAVPHSIKMGTKMLLSSLYYNREDTVTGLSVNDIPLSSRRLFEADSLE